MKIGEKCWIQRFVPYEAHVSNEEWTYEAGVITPYGVEIGDNEKSYFLKDDILVFGHTQESSELIFPDRVIPVKPIHLIYLTKDSFSRMAPMYEPEWENKERCTILVPPSEKMDYNIEKLKALYPFSYTYPVSEGIILIVFGLKKSIEKSLLELDAGQMLFSVLTHVGLPFSMQK